MPIQGSALERGNGALARGAWAEARASFEKALEDGESPEAQEGLSWAAWWLNDGVATIHAREAAYRLYRQVGEAASAARMAMWLASDYEDFRGELAIGRGWRERARHLLEDAPVAPEHGLLPVLEGDAALLFSEDTTTARRCAERAAEIARQCGDADIEMVATALEGLALVCEGDIEKGMRGLDVAAAAVLGGEIKDEAWGNKILCYLIYACERIRDFGRAAEWCEKMRDLSDRMSFTFAQGTCRAHYAGVLISRGRWEEAEKALSESAAYLEASRPPWAEEAFVRLGDLRRRQGRLDEATELLRRIEWHPWAMLGLAELALDAHRLQDGEELIDRFLRHVPEENRLQRAAALEILVRIAALSGKHRRAAEALADLEAVTEAVATLPLRGAACFSAAAIAIASGELEKARADLEDAVDLFGRSGTPYEAARARLELAAVLVSLDRLDRAASEAKIAGDALQQLGSAFHARRAAALLNDIERRKAGTQAPPGGQLTARQVDILRLVSKGKNDREIAASLGLSEHTVHRHVANILTRLDMPTRAAAAAYATSRGLI